MTKDMLLSIGEASKLSGVSIKTIRYYSNIGLITPSFIDKNQYRYFSIHEICWICSIKFLRQNHFSVSDIKDFITFDDIDSFLGLYKKVRKNIKTQLQSLINADKRVQNMILNLNNVINIEINHLSDSSVKIKKYEERNILSIRETGIYDIKTIPRKVHALFKFAREKEINITPPVVALFYESIENSEVKPVDHELGFYYYGKFNKRLSNFIKSIPEGLYAIIYYNGNQENTIKAQKILSNFILKNKFKMDGPFIKEFVFNNRQSKNINKTISSLQVKFQ